MAKSITEYINLKINEKNADFWIVRRGSIDTVGMPTKKYNPEHYGIIIKNKEQLDSNYLFYLMQYVHSTGFFKKLSKGSTHLVNVDKSVFQKIKFNTSDSENLSEAKFSKKKIIAYHSTRNQNLASIIQNGLIPKFEKGWGSSRYDEDYGISFESLGGIYFTKSAKVAMNILVNLLDEFNDSKDGAIIVAELQPKTAIMDEDYINRLIDFHGESISNSIRKLTNKSFGSKSKLKDGLKKIHTQILQNAITDLSKSLSKFASSKHAYEVIKNTKVYLSDYILLALKNKLNLGYHTSDELDHLRNKVRRSLKTLIQHEIGAGHYSAESFSVDDAVKFTGANKIIGIANMDTNTYWGELNSPALSNRLKKVQNKEDLLR